MQCSTFVTREGWPVLRSLSRLRSLVGSTNRVTGHCRTQVDAEAQSSTDAARKILKAPVVEALASKLAEDARQEILVDDLPGGTEPLGEGGYTHPGPGAARKSEPWAG